MSRACPSGPRRFVGVLLLITGLRVWAADADAPYVMPGAPGAFEAWTIEHTDEGVDKHVVALRVGGKFTVPAVDRVPAFEVVLRKPAPPAPDGVPATKAPLFVVADTHGEYEILVGMLRAHRVVDDRLRWRFGRGRLVVLGDVFDRGPNHTEILWLLYELEAQAARAGGAVYLLLGNHEVMVLGGDLRYLNPKYRRTAEHLGVGSYAELFGPTTLLGQWLRTRAVVMKVGDLLCLHGGISPELVARGLTPDVINAATRAALQGQPLTTTTERERAALLFGQDGPLWYRGYFAELAGAATATEDDVERIRRHFDVTRILVGHTRVPTVTPLYGGKVIAVQVYPKRLDSGAAEFEALLVRDGIPRRARLDGRVERLMP